MDGGIPIPESADMNSDTYKTPGNYFCSSSTVANSLKNVPFSNAAFTLKVGYSTGKSYPSQTFKAYRTGKVAYRMYDAYSQEWSDWLYFSDDATFLSYHSSTTASDFNEMRSIGAYWINPSVTTENHPSNTFGTLEVMGGMQRFTEYDNQKRIFVRFYANSQWTSWVSFDHS